jgi:oligosaccharide repeat unit polymerase
MIQLAIVIVSLLHFAAVAVLYRVRRRNPVFIFVIFNWYFSTGTLFNLDPKVPADIEHAYLQIFASFSVLAFSLLFFNRRRYQRTERIFLDRLNAERKSFTLGTVWALMLFSLAVSYVYFTYLVGYNLFLPAVAGADLDFTTMRLQSYAGDTYTGAGIVNQFKNTILPITFSTLILRYLDLRQWAKLLAFLVIFGPIFLWVILGTGQRTFLFFSLAGFMYAFPIMNRRISPIVLFLTVALFLVLFGVFSLALGRIEDASFFGVLNEVAYRFLNANQAGAVFGFRYVFSQDIVYGTEWLQTIIGFLPGVRSGTLSNEVFNQVFGGYRGTIPVSLWTSIYHNFGLIGVFPVTAALMKLVEYAHLLLRRIPTTTVHLVTYSFLSFYLAILPLTSPFQIINNGLLAIVLVFLLASIQFRGTNMLFRFS